MIAGISAAIVLLILITGAMICFSRRSKNKINRNDSVEDQLVREHESKESLIHKPIITTRTSHYRSNDITTTMTTTLVGKTADHFGKHVFVFKENEKYSSLAISVPLFLAVKIGEDFIEMDAVQFSAKGGMSKITQIQIMNDFFLGITPAIPDFLGEISSR